VHNLGKKTSLKGLPAIFIEESKESFIPYFIEKTSVRSETETLLKLEGLNSKESAKKVYPKEVWLPEADFKKFAAASAPIALLGFGMVEDGKALGTITEVIEQPHQVLCTIIINGKEALIPLHEESLVKVDQKNKQVIVTLPDGLLEIYQ
jgi:16S rRNA processing protein RimM